MADRKVPRSDFIDLTGLRVGRLTVLRLLERATKTTKAYWECRCDCGTLCRVQSSNLKYGTQVSCGCYNRDRLTTHGKTRTTEYNIWNAMRDRCSNPKNHAWAAYGGRGITVCAAWASFEQFYADMGPRPAGYSMDRKNNDGNYEPGNVFWVTTTTQARNTRSNVFITHAGRTQTLSAWAQEVGIHAGVIRTRLKRGWPVELALSRPPSPLRHDHDRPTT